MNDDHQPDTPVVAGEKIIQPLNPELVRNELAKANETIERSRAEQAQATSNNPIHQTPNPSPTVPAPTGVSKSSAPATTVVIRFYGAIASITGVLTLVNSFSGKAGSMSESGTGLWLAIGFMLWGLGCLFGGLGLLLLRRWGRSLIIQTFVVVGLLLLPWLPFLGFLGIYAFASIVTAPQVAIFIIPAFFTIFFAPVIVFPKTTKQQLS